MSQDLKRLITWPEAQGAHRVVTAVAQLEQHLANLLAQKGTSANPLTPQAEISRLREQNLRLTQRQNRALGKLDTLLQTLQLTPDEPAAQNVAQTAGHPELAAAPDGTVNEKAA